jgi:hypothetical protein
VCIAEHRAGHEDGCCDLCSGTVGDGRADITEVLTDVRADITEVLTDVHGSSITTGTLDPSPSLERLVLGRVHVVGRVSERCYVGHADTHLRRRARVLTMSDDHLSDPDHDGEHGPVRAASVSSTPSHQAATRGRGRVPAVRIRLPPGAGGDVRRRHRLNAQVRTTELTIARACPRAALFDHTSGDRHRADDRRTHRIVRCCHSTQSFVWGRVDGQEGEAERFEPGDEAVQGGGVGERAGQRRRLRADLDDEVVELVEDPGG